MDLAEKQRKVEHLLRVKFPFRWEESLADPFKGPVHEQVRKTTFATLQKLIAAERATLLAKPDSEIERLFSAAPTVAAARAELASSLDERRVGAPFYDASSVDFSYWAKADHWSLDESVALLLGKSPDVLTWAKVQPLLKISTLAKQFERLRNLAVRATALNFGQAPAAPLAVLDWARDMEIQVPEVLSEAVYSRAVRRLKAPGMRDGMLELYQQGRGQQDVAPVNPMPSSGVISVATEAAALMHPISENASPDAELLARAQPTSSLTTDEVCEAFDKVGMTSQEWRTTITKNLPDWLTACRTMVGKTGAKPVQAKWDPLKLAVALVTGRSRKAGAVPVAKLDAAFKRQPLRKFAQDWEALRADNPAWGD